MMAADKPVRVQKWRGLSPTRDQWGLLAITFILGAADQWIWGGIAVVALLATVIGDWIIWRSRR